MASVGGDQVEHRTSALAQEHRQATEQHGEVVVQRCGGCAAVQYPPLLRCSACGGTDLMWTPAGTKGIVATWVTVHGQADTPSMSIPGRLRDRTPYATVFLNPDRAPNVRIAALHFPDEAAAELAVGARVSVALEDVGGRRLPVCTVLAD